MYIMLARCSIIQWHALSAAASNAALAMVVASVEHMDWKNSQLILYYTLHHTTCNKSEEAKQYLPDGDGELAGAGRRRWMHVCRKIQRQRSEDVRIGRRKVVGVYRRGDDREPKSHDDTGNGQNVHMHACWPAENEHGMHHGCNSRTCMLITTSWPESWR